MKVGIVIVVYNLSTDVFLLQMEAIKKYCKDENYTIEIIDNSSNEEMSEAIRYHSQQDGLSYRKTFSANQNSSTSHSFAANLSYQKLKDSYDMFAYFDHDLIPIYNFSIEEILKDNKIMAGLGQGGEVNTYFWPGCVMWNNLTIDKDIIDFSPIEGMDTGAGLKYVIEKYGKENCVFFNEAYHQNPYFIDAKYGYISMINHEMFAHAVNASNWAAAERHQERMNAFVNFVKQKGAL